MLGGRWRGGGWSAGVRGLLIGGIWIMSRIGLDRYCRYWLGCRLTRSCGCCCATTRDCARQLGRGSGYSSRSCGLGCRRSGLS